MNLIILIVICLLACAFLLYVLLQWMRDTKANQQAGSGFATGATRAIREKRARPGSRPGATGGSEQALSSYEVKSGRES
jgi:hypothetical protein